MSGVVRAELHRHSGRAARRVDLQRRRLLKASPASTTTCVTLWEAHGTWTPGRFEFAALYANGHISNTSKVNITFIGNPTLIPESFYGWYGQAAYDLLDWDGNSLRPFVRFERLNTASNYSDLSPGLTPENGPDQDIITGGFSFLFAQGVVLKADYQHFHGVGESDLINFGNGISVLMAEADRGVFGIVGAAALMMPASVVVAADYLTIDAAQKAIFPSADSFEPLVLRAHAAEQKSAIAALAGPQPPHGSLRVWKRSNAGTTRWDTFCSMK